MTILRKANTSLALVKLKNQLVAQTLLKSEQYGNEVRIPFALIDEILRTCSTLFCHGDNESQFINQDYQVQVYRDKMGITVTPKDSDNTALEFPIDMFQFLRDSIQAELR
jgi:hypothetical protein